MVAMPETPVATTHAAPNRILSVDVLRGMTMALMILVNDPGDGAHTYAQLDHATWNGLTLTDLVFPTFLFVVGASIIFSLAGRVARGDSKTVLARNIVRRGVTIVLIDFFLALFPFFHFSHLRIFGVLTRIGICYMLVGLLCLITRRITVLLSIALGLLVGYWALMRFVPVPGFGTPTHDMPILDPVRNLAAFIDRGFNQFTQRVFHTGHLYLGTSDPEGILSTIPSLSTVIFGALTGIWLRRSVARTHSGALTSTIDAPPGILKADASQLRPLQTPLQTFVGLLGASVVFLLIGFLWDRSFPINKNLWTSSFVFAAAGFSLLGLSFCYGLIDLLQLERRSSAVRAFLWPWLVFGSNAITAYATSNFLVDIFGRIHVSGLASASGRPISLMGWTYTHIFASRGSTENTSLAFSICYVALCFIPVMLLWRKRIFLKV